jgi:HK97 family phage major capsid protein
MNSNDTRARESLKAIREELASKRSERTDLQREQDTVKGAMATVEFSGDTDILNSQSFRDAERIVGQLGQCKDKISDLEGAESTLLKLLGDSAPSGAQLERGNGYVGGAKGEVSMGWNGHQLLVESDAYQDMVVSRGVQNSDVHFGTMSLGKVCTREELGSFLAPRNAAGLPTAPAAPQGTDQGVVVPDVRGVYPPALKPLSFMDLIPTGTTDSNIIQYVQVSAIPGYAAETQELGLKPQEGITFTDATAPVRTIAGYIKLARQALDDMAGLATLINTLIPYDIRRRMENQMLQGDGIGQDITGIINTAGIGAPASVAGDTIPDGILRAMTTVILSDGDPSFVTLNPITWQNMAIEKNANGSYLFEFPVGIFGTYAARTIWGLAVTTNRIVNKPLVGDPAGATLLVREGVNIKTSDADQDDFIRNRVTVLGETRVAMPVWRPTAFALAPLS